MFQFRVTLFLHDIICGVGIRKHQCIKTPVICAIFDTQGELAAAVAGVEAVVS